MPYWITEQIAVSGAAISPGNWRELVEEIGITAVVNMRTEYQDVFAPPLPIAYLWLPVVDHTDPTPEQLLLGAQFIHAAIQANQRVLVHCKMGIGRSPTMAAAYLVWTGCPVDEAIRQVEGTPKRPFGPVIRRITLEAFAAWLQRNQKEK
jgi:protein-tyrosine phosphatase